MRRTPLTLVARSASLQWTGLAITVWTRYVNRMRGYLVCRDGTELRNLEREYKHFRYTIGSMNWPKLIQIMSKSLWRGKLTRVDWSRGLRLLSVKDILGYSSKEVRKNAVRLHPVNGEINIHKQNKSANIWSSGIHAREWISPATVTYLINEILTSSNSEFSKIARAHNWFIFPSTNPDGYEYTHTKVSPLKTP